MELGNFEFRTWMTLYFSPTSSPLEICASSVSRPIPRHLRLGAQLTQASQFSWHLRIWGRLSALQFRYGRDLVLFHIRLACKKIGHQFAKLRQVGRFKVRFKVSGALPFFKDVKQVGVGKIGIEIIHDATCFFFRLRYNMQQKFRRLLAFIRFNLKSSCDYDQSILSFFMFATGKSVRLNRALKSHDSSHCLSGIPQYVIRTGGMNLFKMVSGTQNACFSRLALSLFGTSATRPICRWAFSSPASLVRLLDLLRVVIFSCVRLFEKGDKKIDGALNVF